MTDQYGPNTADVEAFLALLPGLTHDEWEQVNTAWSSDSDTTTFCAAWNVAVAAGRDSDRGATWDTDWGATWHAAWDASLALVVRDLITAEQYTILTAPFAGIERFAAVLDHPRRCGMTGKYGPHTADVEAFLALLPSLTHDECGRVVVARYSTRLATGHAAWDAAWDAAWRSTEEAGRGAARDAAWDAVWDAVWDAPSGVTRYVTRYAARDVARALVVRDLISDEQYTILVSPFAGIARFAAVLAHPGKDTP